MRAGDRKRGFGAENGNFWTSNGVGGRKIINGG